MKVGDNTPSGSGPDFPPVGTVSASPQVNLVTISKPGPTEKTVEAVYPNEKATLKEKDETLKAEEIAK